MSNIKEVGGVWLPGHEEHMVEWMRKKNQVVDGKLTYQYHKLEAAMKFVKTFGVAVDIGAHVGLWSMHLAKRFSFVHAFEPVALHREAFALNVPSNHVMHAMALGEKDDVVQMSVGRGSSGDTRVAHDSDQAYKGFERERISEAVPLRRLDDIIPEGLVHFIKLDCEGYELFALRGGEELLKRSRPCVCVEQKPGFAKRFGLEEQAAVKYLQDLGARLRKEIGGDFILSWD